MVTLLASLSQAVAADAVWYVVRHAEKATEPARDPVLTEAGARRADALARLLADVPLVAVSSTNTTRTRSTASPTASQHHLDVGLYDDLATMVAAGKAEGGARLVVGHSNTVTQIIELLGGRPGNAVAESEFDRLTLVVAPEGGPVTTIVLRYGP